MRNVFTIAYSLRSTHCYAWSKTTVILFVLDVSQIISQKIPTIILTSQGLKYAQHITNRNRAVLQNLIIDVLQIEREVTGLQNIQIKINRLYYKVERDIY